MAIGGYDPYIDYDRWYEQNVRDAEGRNLGGDRFRYAEGEELDRISRDAYRDYKIAGNTAIQDSKTAARQAMVSNEGNRNFQVDEFGNQSLNGLPIYIGSDGTPRYDVELMGLAEGLSPESINYLADLKTAGPQTGKIQYDEAGNVIRTAFSQDNPFRTQRDRAGMPSELDTDMGHVLMGLWDTPAMSTAPVDLSNPKHMENLRTGRTTGATDIDSLNKNLYYEQTKDKWYNAGRLVPMATMAGMALVGGLAGGALFAPAGASVGGVSGAGVGLGGLKAGTLGSAMAMGAGAGAGGATPGAFFQGVQGDVGGALKSVGMGTAIGGAMGGVTHGIGQGIDALSGGGTPETGAMQMKDPVTGKIVNVAPQEGTLNQYGLFDVDDATRQSIQDAVNGSTNTGVDMFGRTAADRMPARSEFERMIDPNDPSNDLRSMKDLYRTGNTETLSSLGFMTDTGKMLGLTPSNLAIPGGVDPSGMPWNEIVGAGLGLIGPDGAPTMGHTGVDNSMYTPRYDGIDVGNYLTSGSQAAGAGIQQDGMTLPSEVSQQYGAVRPVMENYSQDLLSMVQANPEMLDNPHVYNMVMEQLQGGMDPRKLGLQDPLMSTEAVM